MADNQIEIAMELGAFDKIGRQTTDWTDERVFDFWLLWAGLEEAGAELLDFDAQQDGTYVAKYSHDFRKHCANHGITLE